MKERLRVKFPAVLEGVEFIKKTYPEEVSGMVVRWIEEIQRFAEKTGHLVLFNQMEVADLSSFLAVRLKAVVSGKNGIQQREFTKSFSFSQELS